MTALPSRAPPMPTAESRTSSRSRLGRHRLGLVSLVMSPGSLAGTFPCRVATLGPTFIGPEKSWQYALADRGIQVEDRLAVPDHRVFVRPHLVIEVLLGMRETRSRWSVRR